MALEARREPSIAIDGVPFERPGETAAAPSPGLTGACASVCVMTPYVRTRPEITGSWWRRRLAFPAMRREISHALELDDDRSRIDVDAVHDYLSNESYWAKGRSRHDVARTVSEAARVVGLYDGPRQVGFARVLSDNITIAYLCDVYVLSDYRGRGLGVELVRETVDGGPQRNLRWWLGTADAHGLYRRFGFEAPGDTYLTRPGRR